MKFTMNDKTYDILKWIAMTVLPAGMVFFGLIGNTLGWDFTEAVLTICSGLVTFLGTILGISNAQYQAENNGH